MLSPDQTKCGVVLADIGAETIDIAIYNNEILQYTAVVPMAGRDITKDILNTLRITMYNAEKIKKEYGHALVNTGAADEIFQIAGIGGQNPIQLSKNDLAHIIQAKLVEILDCITKIVTTSEVKFNAGLVLTGGSAMLPGIADLAQDVIGMPVQTLLPIISDIEGLTKEVEHPGLSTALGLTLFGFEEKNDDSGNYFQPTNVDTNETQNDNGRQRTDQTRIVVPVVPEPVEDYKSKLFDKVKDLLNITKKHISQL